MQPEHRRKNSRQMAIARAQMHFKVHFGWLDGYPIARSQQGLNWQPRPRVGDAAPKRLAVDRQRIVQTQRGVTKLASRFPKAMLSIVGDTDNWQKKMLSHLDRLKDALDANHDVIFNRTIPADSLECSC